MDDLPPGSRLAHVRSELAMEPRAWIHASSRRLSAAMEDASISHSDSSYSGNGSGMIFHQVLVSRMSALNSQWTLNQRNPNLLLLPTQNVRVDMEHAVLSLGGFAESVDPCFLAAFVGCDGRCPL
jgi:hypothetical protein